jgi:signal transduction histidine kinase
VDPDRIDDGRLIVDVRDDGVGGTSTTTGGTGLAGMGDRIAARWRR